jgi:polysaccharide export outer membrane protein
MSKYFNQFKWVPIILILALNLTSCVNNKPLLYFPDLRDSNFVIKNADFIPKIQKGDILFIAVNSPDPQSSLLFSSVNNISVPGAASVPGATATPGFLVEHDGSINFPKMGKIQAAGKTKFELAAEIQKGLVDYLKDPIVNIRFMNFKVTVLGEVAKPGTYTTPNDKLTILEAISLAGDLTGYGTRNTILLLRDSANITVSHRLNINDNSLFKSNFYYLQSNDVIYVEPRKTKALSTSQSIIIIPLVLSSITTLLVLLSYFK